MDEAPLQMGQAYLLKHTTRTLKAYVTRIHYRLDVDTLHREHPETFTLNNIGRVELQTASPLFLDPFKLNRATGSFILIDPVSNATAAAGMILRTSVALDELRPSGAGAATRPNSPGVIWRELNVPREVREQRHGHQAGVIWLTGLSGAGKSTIARALERRLFELGCATMLLDGDEVRHGLCGDLGFAAMDRAENIRRVGEVARLFFEAGHVVLCSFISPFLRDRATARALVPAGRFLEVHVACDLATCQARDPNGLYAKAVRGEIRDFTGIGSPYEPPLAAELTVDTAAKCLDETVELLLERLRALGWVPGATG
jgi:bifunctional enzyme CysN/CysC